MGLTRKSTGTALDGAGRARLSLPPGTPTVALAGNPNVGKSTVFNALTGMKQHTGNWSGKTVSKAEGVVIHRDKRFLLVDLPGTYSLMANSAEEEIARDFLCFDRPDAAVVVTDATCLERNLNLVLQVSEITDRVVVCVNLLDEARKKGIVIDLDELSLQLGVPVVGTSARAGKGLTALMDEVDAVASRRQKTYPPRLTYHSDLEEAIAQLQPFIAARTSRLPARWLCLRLLDGDETLRRSIAERLGLDPEQDPELKEALETVRRGLGEQGMTPELFRDCVASGIMERAEQIYRRCVTLPPENAHARDRRLDKILASKATGIPVMILLLGLIFWITIAGANLPSEGLSTLLFGFEKQLAAFCTALHAPDWVRELFVSGIYRTLAWVVSVMLPPMAIFFPLFTLLEDSGYLPRIAFNMDHAFQKARTHGKQALTMAMGFGCNACGVIGCRIIDSPRERLIATVTNNLVPCNGRFPPFSPGKQKNS